MSKQKEPGAGSSRADGKQPSGRKPRKSRVPSGDGDALDPTWDQPQPRYPAPERPKDRADEGERRA
jgi:hypothetical protein